jgi:hypothetical protein
VMGRQESLRTLETLLAGRGLPHTR